MRGRNIYKISAAIVVELLEGGLEVKSGWTGWTGGTGCGLSGVAMIVALGRSRVSLGCRLASLAILSLWFSFC